VKKIYKQHSHDVRKKTFVGYAIMCCRLPAKAQYSFGPAADGNHSTFQPTALQFLLRGPDGQFGRH